MGSFTRGNEAAKARPILEKKVGCDLGKILKAYEVADGSLAWACFHVGKEHVKKLWEALYDESVIDSLDEIDVYELRDDLAQDLESMLDPTVPFIETE